MSWECSTAMTYHTSRTNSFNSFFICHVCKVIRVDRLMQTVFFVVFNDNTHDFASVWVQSWLNCNYLTRNSCMNWCRHKTASFSDRLTKVNYIASFNYRLCRSTDVHRNRQNHHIRCRQYFYGFSVCCGFITWVRMRTWVNTATKRVHHEFHLSI